MAVGIVERVDHGGLMAAIITDRGLIDMIHPRVVPDSQEEIPPGAAVAGMSLTGVGCATRPVSLPPPCVANTPLDVGCR